MVKAKIILPISLLFVLLIVSSCGESTQFYRETHDFKSHSWDIKEKPTFKVEIKDTTKQYDFNFVLRTTTDFAYSNLWVYLTTELPNGKSERRPYEFRITDDKGNWLGNNTGSIVETPITFKNMKLPKAGTYVFKVEQGVTQPKIQEVIDLTLTVNPATSISQ